VNLKVIYEDNHLLVVDKPAGILSQGDRTGDPDVVSMGKAWVKERYNKPGAVYLGLVHRLDRPASGLMVLARTSKAASRLSLQFQKRTVGKTYFALVEGTISGAGVMEDYLQKKSEIVRVVGEKMEGAKKAVLQYRLLHAFLDVKGYPVCSLVEIELETGRSHQIRVQFASRGFPLIGDFRYGSKSELDGRNLALHAARLSILHPTKKDPVSWESPLPNSWPEQVRVWLSTRRSSS